MSEQVVIVDMAVEIDNILLWFQKEKKDFKEVWLASWEGGGIFSQGKVCYYVYVSKTRSIFYGLEK